MHGQSLVSRRNTKVVGSLLCMAVLAACGSDSEDVTAVPQVKKADAVQAPVDPTAKMARAVNVGKSTVPIELKYEIASKPIVDQPIEIELAIVPKQGADSMTIGFAASGGLTLSAESAPSIDVVKSGQPHTVKLSAMTDKPEMFYVTVTATLYSAGSSSARTFAIPLIVSQPTPPAAADAEKTPAAPKKS